MINMHGLATCGSGKAIAAGTSRFWLRSAAVLCVLLIACDADAQDSRNSADKPNVLFIAIDDLRPELGCYGADHILSPNIDRFASQGIQFNRAYCQFPVCGPSRASLLSGVYPTSTRFIDNSALVETETADVLTLPGAFRRAGYYTVGNGKIYHHANDTAEQSWSEPPVSLINGPKDNNHQTFHDKDSANYIEGKRNRGPFFEMPDVPDNTYIDGQTCEKTIKDLRRLAKMDQPFFLACGFVRPHLPFYAPKKYWDLYDRDEIELADNRYTPKDAPPSLRSTGEIRTYHDRGIKYNSTEFHKIARHGYYACVNYADTLVGRLLANLDELGLRQNTIVVLWGDHGWHLGEHNFWSKNNLLHNATRLPLIIHAPGFKQNVETDGIVELIDLYPTLCELAGIERPDHLQGASMVPLMHDPTRPGKDAAFTRDTQGAAVTTQDYVYAEFGEGERMLFDHKNDPDENVNVADNPEYRETAEKLSKLLAGQAVRVKRASSNSSSDKENLVAHWPLDDSNQTARDVVGGHHGRIVGATATEGRIGGALKFGGEEAGHHVTVPFDRTFQLHSFTVAAWVNLAAEPTFSGVLGTRHGGEHTFDLKVNVNYTHGDIGDGSRWIEKLLNIWKDDVGSNDQGGDLELGRWYHLAWAVDNDKQECRLFIDADLKKTIPFEGKPVLMLPGRQLHIGHSSGTEYMNGAIDDVRIYSSALEPHDVSELVLSADPTVK